MLNLLTSYMNGFFVGASLIMAIGAQNAFVLAQGLRREYHRTVALICMSCDAALILAGIFGLANLLQRHPMILAVTRWGGVLFLCAYAALAIKRALRPHSLSADRQPPRSYTNTIIAALAVTLLNPHVYLDTVVLIGAVGAQQQLPGWFAFGAVSASAVWFSSLALGAARLAPWLARPMTWRLVDAAVALMMLTVAWGLARPALASG